MEKIIVLGTIRKLEFNYIRIWRILKKLVGYQGNNTYPDIKEIFITFRANFTEKEIEFVVLSL